MLRNFILGLLLYWQSQLPEAVVYLKTDIKMAALLVLMLSIGASAIAIGNGGSQLLQLSSPNLSRPAAVLPTSISASLPPLNLSAAITPVNDLSDYALTCAGPTYGFFHDEEVSACLDATKIIAAGRDRMRFAVRDTPEVTPDAYPLPWRWMDRRSTQNLP